MVSLIEEQSSVLEKREKSCRLIGVVIVGGVLLMIWPVVTVIQVGVLLSVGVVVEWGMLEVIARVDNKDCRFDEPMGFY